MNKLGRRNPIEDPKILADVPIMVAYGRSWTTNQLVVTLVGAL